MCHKFNDRLGLKFNSFHAVVHIFNSFQIKQKLYLGGRDPPFATCTEVLEYFENGSLKEYKN
jgi:hypothetical protein